MPVPDIMGWENHVFKDVHDKDAKGFTPLHVAASCSNAVHKVIPLLEALADPTAKDKTYWTPLHWAAQQGSIKVVEVLLKAMLEAGADCDPRDRSDGTGQMPLHLAAQQGHLQVVEALIEARADVNATEDRHGHTPLLRAAPAGYALVTKALLEAKADHNMRDPGYNLPDGSHVEGHTALHYTEVQMRNDWQKVSKELRCLLEGEMAQYEKAEQGYIAAGATNTADYATLLKTMADNLTNQGHTKEGLVQYQKAEQAYVAAGTTDASDFAELKAYLGRRKGSLVEHGLAELV